MIETERTILRLWTEDDASDLLPVFGSREAMRFWNTSPVTSLDDMRAMIGRSRAASPEQHQAFSVISKENGRAVGMVNFHHREPMNRRLEIGFITAPQYQRRGLTLQAVTALVGHCFAALHAHRIEALTDPQNVASKALLERVGFKQEGGCLRQRIVLGNGFFGDQLVYSRLSDDE